MKKRIISLLLCLVTLLPAALILASCGNGSMTVGEPGDAIAQTLVIAAIKDEKTTDEALLAVQEKLNEITEAEYNTHVVLKFFTADEYAQKIMEMSQRLAAKQESFEAQLTGAESVTDPREYDEELLKELGVTENMKAENGDYYYLAEFDTPKTVYPAAGEDQLDIIFIDSIETYYQLMDNRYITCLNADIANNGGFRKYTSNAMLSRVYQMCNGIKRVFAKDDAAAGDAYAIPNNYITESANYLLINKKLYDHYNYDILCDTYVADANNVSGVDDLADLDMFLNEVMKGNATNGDLKVDKILYNYSGWDTYSYFGEDDGAFSLIGLTATRGFNTALTPKPDSLLKRTAFKKAMTLVYDLKTLGTPAIAGDCFYRESDEEAGFMVPRATMAEMAEAGQSFAVAMVSGDTKLADYYSKEDYYVVRTSAYEIDNTMFESMYAISTFSTTAVDVDNMWLQLKLENYEDNGNKNPRAFEIISMLQTNAEAVNLLTYGVQGVDYDVYDNDPKVYNVGKGDYKPVYGLGNMFLTKESDSMDSRTAYYAANEWEAAKLQMRASVCTPFCGFLIRDFEQPEKETNLMTSPEIRDELQQISAEMIEKINNFSGVDADGKECTISEYIEDLQKELGATEAYELAVQSYKLNDDRYTGPTYEAQPYPQYNRFYFLVYHKTPDKFFG
ncbi:MAG: hypothetical protein J6M12_00845 [Clostridia bacterium]|nr:hypothetical protein [Clostridia bacterium]